MPRRSRWFRNGGQPHRGWYKNIWCDSAWELAFVMWNIDNGREIVRNTEDFPYKLYNKTMYYRPDFLVEGTYYEVKGVLDGRSKRKIDYFPYPIVKIGLKEIKPYIKYAKEKYGTRYYELLNQ